MARITDRLNGYTGEHMILHLFTFLIFAGLSMHETRLQAACEGCCIAEELVIQATATAATAGLPGLPGAAGLPGLAGVPGAPGIAGPPGTIGLAGGVLDYAYIYNTVGDNQSIGAGGFVPFNIPAAFDSNPIYFPPGTTFDHNGTSSVLFIHSTGTYMARYIVTVALAHTGVPTTFELMLDGIPIPGSARSTDIPDGAGQLTMVGEAIFTISGTVPASGRALTVSNSGNGVAGILTQIGVLAPATTAASLFVQKFSN